MSDQNKENMNSSVFHNDVWQNAYRHADLPFEKEDDKKRDENDVRSYEKESPSFRSIYENAYSGDDVDNEPPKEDIKNAEIWDTIDPDNDEDIPEDTPYEKVHNKLPGCIFGVTVALALAFIYWFLICILDMWALGELW